MITDLLNVIRHALKVITDLLNVISDALNVISDLLNAIRQALKVISDALNVISDLLNAIRHALNAVSDALKMITHLLNVIRHALNVISDALNVITDRLNVISHALKARNGPSGWVNTPKQAILIIDDASGDSQPYDLQPEGGNGQGRLAAHTEGFPQLVHVIFHRTPRHAQLLAHPLIGQVVHLA